MRAPRTTYIAFTKFKKMCDTLRECPDNEIACSPTKAALGVIQGFVEKSLMKILVIAADNKRGRTLDEVEMRRAYAYMNHFLLKDPCTGAARPCSLIKLPKKLCVRELKKERPDCRVTQGAVGIIANMYAYFTRVALLAINEAAEQSPKKRVSTDLVQNTLCPLFA